jgi:zinc/manganese transport system substrate-binding protein
VLIVVACACLQAGGCASRATPTRPAGGAAAPGRVLQVVAAENFWGSIVSQLAGRDGHVTSVVTDPNADPHTYEASASTARAFAAADYVVQNGAGYDNWAAKLLGANPRSGRKVLTVSGLLGIKTGANPHFWYDPEYVTRVADQVSADLESLDPAESGYFAARRAEFDSALAPSRSLLASIRSAFAGTPVASTESIFVYLADYLGLRVPSPVEFMNAVAEGNDPPAPAVVEFQHQLTTREVKVLVYNRQTATEVTTNIEKLATSNRIPVVGVTETIQPAAASFEDWFGAELRDLQQAL